MSIALATVARNALCDALVDLADSAQEPGRLQIRGGPAVLVTIALQKPAFGSAADGTAIANGLPIYGVATADGIADNYRVLDGSGITKWSGAVTPTGGGGSLTLDNTSIAIGQEISVAVWSHTVP